MLSLSGKRRINIDPGILSENELVLASFKRRDDFKKDIGKGVFAHKVLEVRGGKAAHFWHTFKDYREEKNKRFFFGREIAGRSL